MSAPLLSIASPVTEKHVSVHVDETIEAEWHDLLCDFDDASIYQSWAYGATQWGDHQLSHLVLRRGSAVIAMAQVRVVQLPLIRKGIAYIRWGPLCRLRGQVLDPTVINLIYQTLKREYVERRGLLLRVMPHVFE